MVQFQRLFVWVVAIAVLHIPSAQAATYSKLKGRQASATNAEALSSPVNGGRPGYYGKGSLYNQNAGADPMSWLLSGPALDTAAASLQRPYYKALGYNSVPRNYIYYDWGW